MLGGSGAITLGTIRGIRIGVDWSWFVVLFLIIVWLSGYYRDILGAGAGTATTYGLAVASALLFFGSILLHELGHAFVALRNGIGIAGITLWMFGGVARMERDTHSAGAEFKVAAGGPAVSLGLVLAGAGLGAALASPAEFRQAALVDGQAEVSAPLALLAWLTFINALVLIFNLIPAYPLDGGRIARALAWRVTGDRATATRLAARVGQGFAWLFIAGGVALALGGHVFDGLWLAFIGFILNQSATAAIRQSPVQERLEGVSVADVMDDEPVAIPQQASVRAALDEYFLRYRWPWFPVVDADGRLTGVVRREQLDADGDAGEPGTVGQAMREADEEQPDLAVSVERSLESVLGNRSLRERGAVMAIDAEGRLRGVLTADAVRRTLQRVLGRDGSPSPGSRDPGA